MKKIILYCFLSVLFVDCATIISHSRQKMFINSYPQNGAKVFQGKKMIGQTPDFMKVKRRSKDTVLKVVKEGFDTTEIHLKRKINPWLWGNVFNFWGYPIDYWSGAFYKYTNDVHVVSLNAKTELPVISKMTVFSDVSDGDKYLLGGKNKKITFDDFKGAEKEAHSYFAAATYSRVVCEYKLGEQAADVRVFSIFYKELSFFRDVYKKKFLGYYGDEAKKILNHEQRHFDVTELFARKLKKAISQTAFSKNDFEKELNELAFKNMEEATGFQARYDSDVYKYKRHQKRWNKMIDDMLTELQAYSGDTLAIKFSK